MPTELLHDTVIFCSKELRELEFQFHTEITKDTSEQQFSLFEKAGSKLESFSVCDHSQSNLLLKGIKWFKRKIVRRGVLVRYRKG